MLKFLDTANFKIMRKNLDVLTQRMNVTAQNISNVNTPHYKAKKLEFENILQKKIENSDKYYSWRLRDKNSGDKRQKMLNLIDSAEPELVTDNKTETRVDGNNVDIDHENLEMAKIQLQYNFMIRKITDEYNLLKHAVTEGKG